MKRRKSTWFLRLELRLLKSKRKNCPEWEYFASRYQAKRTFLFRDTQKSKKTRTPALIHLTLFRFWLNYKSRSIPTQLMFRHRYWENWPRKPPGSLRSTHLISCGLASWTPAAGVHPEVPFEWWLLQLPLPNSSRTISSGVTVPDKICS